MRDSIIEATISRDILQMEEIRKPALMRALFELGAQYSGQELSYRKILGQLDERGNTDTLKHYLTLLDGAGMLSGLQKYDDKQLRSRASSPRLLVHDPSLMTASWHGTGSLLEQPDLRGHLVESAVGATLLARSKTEGFDLYWWRDGSLGVDFVIKRGDDLSASKSKADVLRRAESARSANDIAKRCPSSLAAGTHHSTPSCTETSPSSRSRSLQGVKDGPAPYMQERRTRPMPSAGVLCQASAKGSAPPRRPRRARR